MKTESERKVEHSPLPWKCTFYGTYSYRINSTALGYIAECNSVGANSTAQNEANAAFIVRACNSHEALVNALQAVDEMFSNPGKINKRTVAEQVRAALKLAGEEGEL